MRYAESLDAFQNFEGVELRQDDVRGAEREHCERNGSGSVRKRSRAQANRIRIADAPVVAGQFHHRAPCDVGDHHAFCRARGATGGDQAHEIVGISVGVCGVGHSHVPYARRINAAKRFVTVTFGVDANAMSQGWGRGS